MAIRVNEQHHQCMTNLFRALCEIHELYKTFEEQSHVLEDHDTQKIVAMKALENVSGWKIHMRDKEKDIPIMDKFQVKKVEVIFETWGSLCDAVQSIIEDGQEACKRRWKALDVLFDFLGLSMLEAIEEAYTLKLKLDEVERSFAASKEQIQGVTQLNLQEITS